MNKLRLIFKNTKSQSESIDYTLADNVVAAKWIKKIKHLQNVKPSSIFTPGRPIINLVVRNQTRADILKNLHKEYCKFADIACVELDYDNKLSLDLLSDLYQENFERLKTQKNNDIIYQFIATIGAHRKYDTEGGDCLGCKQCINCLYHIDWGPQAGLLEEEFLCNPYYADKMLKNNLYLPHASRGKKPLQYFRDQNPANLEKILESATPHNMLKGGFAICQVEKHVEKLPEEFETWFHPFKDAWLNHYNLKDWQPCDEFSAVLLAECNDRSLNIATLIDAYPFFDSVVILE